MKIIFVASVLVATLFARPLLAESPAKPAAGSTPGSVSNKTESLVGAPASNPNEVVARIDGKEIKRAELDRAMQTVRTQLAASGRELPREASAQLEWDTLDQIVSRDLVLHEASAQPVTDLDGKVKTQLDRAKSQLGEEGFAKALKELGLTAEEYEKHLRENIMVQETIQKIVQGQAKVSPEDIKTFYEGNPDAFMQPELVRASHVLIRVPADATDQVKTEKRAKIEAIRARLQKGEKFDVVAKETSEDPGSAAKGGDLGFFRRGAMVPEFDLTAFTLKTNELSEVVSTKFGYHVLLVTDRKTPRVLPLEEVKEQIERYLQSRKAPEIIKQHVLDLRKTAKVEVLIKQPVAPALDADAPPPPVAKP